MFGQHLGFCYWIIEKENRLAFLGIGGEDNKTPYLSTSACLRIEKAEYEVLRNLPFYETAEVDW